MTKGNALKGKKGLLELKVGRLCQRWMTGGVSALGPLCHSAHSSGETDTDTGTHSVTAPLSVCVWRLLTSNFYTLLGVVPVGACFMCALVSFSGDTM